MKVLLAGATGFIGRHVAKALIAAGHEVTGCARDREKAFRRYPGIRWMKADFGADRTVAAWLGRFARGDAAVVNAAGILRERDGQSFEAVHYEGPTALYRACESHGIRRVIHVSALGCDASPRPYATTKLKAEQFVAGLDLDWVVVRPSLVYGEDSPSSRLFRFFAQLPVMPLIGDGRQVFQPIHIDDLAAAVAGLLAPDAPRRVLLEVAGPRAVTFRELLAALRSALTGVPERWLGAPVPLVRAGAVLSDIVGIGPIGIDTLEMLMRGNVATANAAAALLGREPRDIVAFERRASRVPAGNPREELS